MKSRFIIVILCVGIIFSVSAAPVRPADFSSWAREIRLFTFTGGYPAVNERAVTTPAVGGAAGTATGSASAGSTSAGVEAEGLAEAIEKISRRALKPWTQQLRAAGFIRTSEGTVVVVNGGHPVLFDAQRREPFVVPEKQAADEYLRLSRGLTTGTLFVNSYGIPSVHLYRDRFFSTEAAESGGEQRAVVLELNYDGFGSFAVGRPVYGFAADNPEWEPVELIRKDDRNLISWKFSDSKKTRFRYLIHSENGDASDEIDAAFFRDEYSLYKINDGPFSLRGFERAVREDSVEIGTDTAGDIYLKLTAAGPQPGNAPQAYYSSAGKRAAKTGAGIPVQLTACQSGSLWYILGDDRLFVCGSDISSLQLPKLPENFVYTDVFVEGRHILLCWEEKRFPYTGRAGMILIERQAG